MLHSTGYHSGPPPVYLLGVLSRKSRKQWNCATSACATMQHQQRCFSHKSKPQHHRGSIPARPSTLCNSWVSFLQQDCFSRSCITWWRGYCPQIQEEDIQYKSLPSFWNLKEINLLQFQEGPAVVVHVVVHVGWGDNLALPLVLISGIHSSKGAQKIFEADDFPEMPSSTVSDLKCPPRNWDHSLIGKFRDWKQDLDQFSTILPSIQRHWQQVFASGLKSC